MQVSVGAYALLSLTRMSRSTVEAGFAAGQTVCPESVPRMRAEKEARSGVGQSRGLGDPAGLRCCEHLLLPCWSLFSFPVWF